MQGVAEFRDWLNRTVLLIDFQDDGSNVAVGKVRIVFQKNVFVDNLVGWRDETQAEISLYDFCFSRPNIEEFVISAKRWLALPIESLGSIYFSGKWELGGENSSRFNLEFRPYSLTPSKTDWFTVRVEINTEVFSWTKELHSDHSCLALFVEGLTASSDKN